jgi:ATP-binding cassette subfamily B (MDR/TAP) protein 1
MAIINEYVYVYSKRCLIYCKLTVLQLIYCISLSWATALDIYSHSNIPLASQNIVSPAHEAQIGFRITSLQVSATIRLNYLQALLQLPISTLDGLPPGQTTAIITITANILQLGISERLSSLIQAVSVIFIALLIGCVFSWELTLVTFTGLVAIVGWYAVITPIVARRYAEVQRTEREAAGVAAEALSSMKMIAACGAEGKIAEKYNKLVNRTKVTSQRLSPILALQHSPGMQIYTACYNAAHELQCFS